MDKKSKMILISILHICILGVCILTVYSNRNSQIAVAHVSSETEISPESAPAETENETDPETMPETEMEMETETETITITEAETETETEANTETAPEAVLYSFHYIGTELNLNIREKPSLSAAIIGKVPPRGGGEVIELTNSEWALIKYNGITGYCSRDIITLTPANQ